MSEVKRPRGAPRRGPFAGKRMSLATKITEQTMARLTAAAKSSDMSVSQMAEVAIVRGLDANDDFHRHFAPEVRCFEEKLIRSMPTRGDNHDLVGWSKRVLDLVQMFADDVVQSANMVCEERGSPKPQGAPELAAPQATTPANTSPKRPRGRILDVS